MRIQELIGKKVTDVLVSRDHQEIIFVFDGLALRYECYAECCSYTWIEAISDPEVLLNAEVLTVEGSSDSGSENDDSYIQYDFIHFCTTKGRSTLEYRNESNGYYSGSLDFVSLTKLSEVKDLQSFVTAPLAFID